MKIEAIIHPSNMWNDRELDEANVYDHKPHENGGFGRSSIDEQSYSMDPPPPPSSTGTPTTTTGNGGPSSLDYHSAPTMDMRMDHNMLDHYESNPNDFMSLDHAQESSMMMMMPTHMTDQGHHHHHHQHQHDLNNHHHQEATHFVNHTQFHPQFVHSTRDDVKLPTAKARDNYLKKYARKFGLNDRGCYIACVLACLAFFFLVIIIAMILSWPASPLRHSGPLHFCSKPPCLEAAAGILGKKNASLDPCTDFYSYACDGWVAHEGIPSSKSSWSTLSAMEYQSRIEKSRLITMASHEPSQFNSIEWKVQNFYQSCMSLSFIESDREKPLTKIINNLGGWEVLRSFNMYSWESHRVLRELHTEYSVNAFFRIDVIADVNDPNRSIIQVNPDGLGMPDKSYYHRLPDDPAIQAYQTFMKDSAQLFGASSTEAHKFSIDMFNFEKRISEITPDGDYLENPMKINNRMTVKDLHIMAINVPWLEILKAAYSDAPLSEETEIMVVSPQYAADIGVIMSTTDRGSLNNYLMWRLVQSYMPYLSKSFREVTNLYRKSLSGAQKPLERWEFCEITTERFFSHLMNSLYAQQKPYLRERQTVVKKLFDYIKHNVAKSVSVSDSYDYVSRRAAMNKLKNMTVQIGTPEFLLDRKYLKLMYNHLLVQKTDFFQNIQYGVIFLRKREELALVSPGEENGWLAHLTALQVGYSAVSNKVIIPEVLLQPPLFHPGFPHSVNLGGLGVKMTESVIKGVTGYGLMFDPQGRLQFAPEHASNFSSSIYFQPLTAFDTSAECLVSSLSSSGVDTPDILRKCRRETAVTVSALQETFKALNDILELEKGAILPAMETFDPQSVFFLTFAQSLCSQQSMKERDIERTARHRLLNQELLKGALSQTQGFHTFFGCSFNDLQVCQTIL
ncbi:hypothetical protein TCAL_00498 [Tigriopus californicus]|uniref:Peptidase M13 N-terminal domain-containing protein n=1 Tax=Tigriopus californicus TaxID=6832 RepID=A0A553NFW8_TIGCA|nr:endothelin-converting enzyme homolog [Tigriopus californicus]TRY64311.1 hypothetical protein TCAL_00498 [Tigriopus californicus]